MRPVGLFLVAVLSGAATAPLPASGSQPQPARPGLTDLLDRWDSRDGAAVFEVGHSLSEEFVREPKGFLAAMADRPNTWRSWLDQLGSHSFTVQREGARPEHEALHEHMMEAASRLVSDPKLSKLARDLKRKLKKVRIREIE